METEWLNWSRRLAALAQTGLSFTRDPFDRERYEEMAGIAAHMLARLADLPVEQVAGLMAPEPGYATPKVDVRGAIVVEDRILLVQEKSDGRWSLPGGYADVGLSASENVVKEIREEAGLEVRVDRLYAVRHKAKGPYDPDLRDFYKLFFLCEPVAGADVRAGFEVADARFFPPGDLPPLSTARVAVRDIEAAFASREGGPAGVLFD
ncbi:NUDIX hydrolase [Pontivivens ytuae]|uniref:NUDIX hydrolase n=1 Tax=Pontivivens ytuae TaxID=2789856 RepID=A0A7S9QBU6_9RHOB|nr:NUDIX hydrolase [Pontivivens ytuae]QPH53135.1 NUDIX hydrolase [Pontivivens ytuae]